MIFDDKRAKKPVINEYFCRRRRNNCNMISFNQNLFSLERQSLRGNCIMFFLFEKRGKIISTKYIDLFDDYEMKNNDFPSLCNDVWNRFL